MIQVIFRTQLIKLFVSIKVHPSILLIKSKLENQKFFSFQPILKFDMEKAIQNIDNNNWQLIRTLSHLKYKL